MKIQKKIITIIMLSITILMGLLVVQSKAANETNSTKANTNSTKSTGNTTNTTSAPDGPTNANLAILGIKPYDFSGFRYGTTSYKVEVPADTESIEVYATPQGSKAKVTGTGKKTLKDGENKFDVVVTAEGGNKRTYTVTVVRAASGKKDTEEKPTEEKPAEEKPEEKNPTEEKPAEEKKKGLTKLSFENLELSPIFEPDIYEYTVKYIGEEKALKIQTEPSNTDYTIEVVGNKDLKEGENLITIIVSEKNGNNVATYQVTVDKKLVDEEAIAKQKEEEEKKANQQKMMIGIAIAAVAIIVIGAIVIIIRKKRNEKEEEDFLGNPYYKDYDDYDDYNDTSKKKDTYEEVPRAFNRELEQKKYNDFGSISQVDAKEQFLKGYTSQYDIDFADRYHDARNKDKHRGKRFK